MDITRLLDQGFTWTAARIAAVPAERLDGPTPCRDWDLRQLLDHTVASLAMLIDAVDAVDAGPAGAGTVAPDGEPPGSTPWDRAIAELAARSRRAWLAPGVMERSFELPMGTMPAPVVASSALLELVVHGWDVSQASGEDAAIPDALARPVLEFARGAIGDAARGDIFGADLGVGDTPSDQLVAFLGRTPR